MGEVANSVRIDFASIDLYGREREIGELERIVTYATRKSHSSESQFVELGGYSGCGKSTLVRTLRPKVAALGGYYVEGHYEQDRDLSQQYGVRQALYDLFKVIMRDGTIAKQLRETFHRQLTPEDVVDLATVIPTLPHFLEQQQQQNNNINDNGNDSMMMDVSTTSQYTMSTTAGTGGGGTSSAVRRPEWAFERMKMVIVKFLSCVCDPTRPIVMVIDNVQWCDTSVGLSLLQLMATSKGMDGLLLVCVYRDNELTEDHLAKKMLRTVQKEKHPTNHYQMKLGNLKVSDIVSLIRDLSFRRIDDELQSLASMLQARTHGNPFFLLQYLRLLVDDGLIRHSPTSMAWTWSERDILNKVSVADNVAEFISHKLRKLPSSTRQALQVASCFGSRFDASLVSRAMNAHVDISKSIDRAVQDGLVEAIEPPFLYKFAHDRIQKAAYDFCSPQEREGLHYKIGLMVKTLMDDNEVTDAIWMVTDQLNKGRNLITTPEEKLELAQLNLRAAEKAEEKSAFYPGVEYLQVGISLIEESKRWNEENYSLSLALYTLLTELERCLGHFEACYEAVKHIAMNARSLDDKIPSTLAQIDALGNSGKSDRAIEEASDLLYQLGEKFPKKPSKAGIAVEFVKTRVSLRGRTDDELENLPLMEDARMKIIMELLALIASFAFHTDMVDHVTMASFRMLVLSLKHGLYSADVFAIYGTMLGSVALQSGSMLYYHEASRFGTLAWKTLPRFNNDLRCRALVVCTLFGTHLKNPFNHCLDPALDSYRAGMQVGEVHFGLCGSTGYLYLYLCVGLPLKPLVKDCQAYAAQMLKYNSIAYFRHATVLQQFVLNLTANRKATSELNGEVMNIDEYLRVSPRLVIEHIHIFQMWLAFLFEDMEKAGKAANLLWNAPRDKDSFLAISFIRRCYQGLVFFRLARETGKRKYKKRGRSIIHMTEKFARAGNVNCLHNLLLLKAEDLRSSKRASPDEIRKAYDKAIVHANRGGFTQTGAVAYNLAFKYFIETNDFMQAPYYLNKAVERYTEWNAMAKVQQLRQMYATHFPASSQSSADQSVESGHFRGVARFNARHSTLHDGRDLASQQVMRRKSYVADVGVKRDFQKRHRPVSRKSF